MTANLDRIPQTVFSVSGIPDHERFDYWKEGISSIFSVDATRDVRSERFRARVTAHMFDTLFLAETQSRRQEWRRTASMIAGDGMDHYMVQLFFHGGTWMKSDSTGSGLPVGGLIVFDLAQVAHTGTTDFHNLSLVIPRTQLEPLLNAPNDQHMRLLPQSDPLVAMLSNHMQTLLRIAPQTSQHQAQELTPITLGLVAACLNGTANGAPQHAPGIAVTKIVEARQLISQRLADTTLTAESLARQIGVSRSTLYQMFEQYGGVQKFIRQRRMHLVARSLRDARNRHRPISDIALSGGFPNLSAFSRDFRAQYGCSPRDYRREYENGLGYAGAAGTDQTYFGSWLHQL